MSFNITNFLNNDDIIVKQTKGCFSIVEYKRDLSVTPLNAMAEYFNGQMNVRKRQLVAQLDRSAITLYNKEPCNGLWEISMQPRD